MAPVLIIDDHADLRDTLRILLEDEGYAVHEAADGVSGHAALQASSASLVVLLDHKLPVMDGCDLLELVMHDQALRRHAYIFLTAGSPAQVQKDCNDLPDHICQAVIYKPFDIDDLLSAVTKAERHLANAGNAG